MKRPLVSLGASLLIPTPNSLSCSTQPWKDLSGLLSMYHSANAGTFTTLHAEEAVCAEA